MNDDEPFEIHRTGHRGRILCLLAVEYAQDNETEGFEIQNNIDLQCREARNIQGQKHILIGGIIVSNANIYALKTNIYCLYQFVVYAIFRIDKHSNKILRKIFRIMLYRNG